MAEAQKKGEDILLFSINSALLDALVLAVVAAKDTYGYEITQAIRQSLDVSESTLYPVLRRLQKDGCLEVYDQEFNGRNRRYYHITESGKAQLALYTGEWNTYRSKIEGILLGGKES